MVYLLNYVTKMSLVKEGNFFVLENTGEEIKLKIVTICFFTQLTHGGHFPKKNTERPAIR